MKKSNASQISQQHKHAFWKAKQSYKNKKVNWNTIKIVALKSSSSWEKERISDERRKCIVLYDNIYKG